MKTGIIHWLAIAMAVGGSIAAAQTDSEEAVVIPPLPGEPPDHEVAAPPPEQFTEPPPPGLMDEERPRGQGSAGPSAVPSRRPMLPPKTLSPKEGLIEEAPPEDAPRLSPRVRRGTAHLDIDEETRARYRWSDGEWWFQGWKGQWLYFRHGKWIEFDPDTYRPPATTAENLAAKRQTYSQPPQGRLSRPHGAYYESLPGTVNGYYYEAPSYRPVPPPPGFYYYPYYPAGRSYGAPWRSRYLGGVYRRRSWGGRRMFRPRYPGFF